MPASNHIRDFGRKDYTRLSEELPRRESQPWRLVCQLPHNAQFQPWIELESAAGHTLRVDSSNHLASWTQPVQSYTTVDGLQCYEAPGWISGEGAVYEIPANVTVRAVKYRETGYNTEFAGSFHCNDDDYDILWQKATRTCYLCMRDHFMDCPDRERTPLCLGDVCIQMEEVFYTFDTKAHDLARKAIERNPNYTHIIDQNLMFAGEYGTWFYYLNTGDLETIRNQYPNLKAYLAKWELGENGVVEHNTDGWDWCDWGSPSKDKTAVQCCQYYSTLKAFRKMAVATGSDGDLPEIDKTLASIEANFDAVFWRDGYYMSDDVDYPDERANALAVITGLASPDKWNAVFDNVLSRKLCPEWEDGNTYNASSYFERWIMEALCKMGREEFALLRMAERYRDQIECRTTTLWEHFGRWWQTKFDPNSTQNHGWNSPNTILSRYIVGVAPATPGWGRFHVFPKEGFLLSLSAKVQTIKGPVSVDIEKTSATYTIRLSAPDGTEAIVGIPRKAFVELDTITVNNRTAWQDGRSLSEGAGSPFDGERDGYLCFRVGPGSCEIVARGALRPSQAKTPRAQPTKRTRLDSRGWTATASHTHRGPTLLYEFGKKQGGCPADALDGDAWTAWSTGVPQEPGQWFALDLGKPETFDQIVIENGWAPYDYPREYKLYVSDDGQEWHKPIAAGAGSPALSTITFPRCRARYVKLENVGASKYWWSMFEIDLYCVDAQEIAN